MLYSPHYMYAQVQAHQDELIAEAEARRLLKSARNWRRACRAAESKRATDSQRVASRKPATVGSAGTSAGNPVAALAGNLATCGRHVAGSAR